MDRILELLGLLATGDITDEQRDELSRLMAGANDAGEYPDESAIPDLNDDQLAEVEAAVVDAFQQADDEDVPDVDTMEALADYADAVRAEDEAREQAAQERAERAEGLRDRMRPADQDDDGDEDPTDEDEDDDEDESEAPPEGGPTAEADDAPTGQDREQVAADGRNSHQRRTLGQMSQQRDGRRAPRDESHDEQVRMSITAAAEVAGFAAGQSIELDDVGRAFANRYEQLSRPQSRAGRGRYPVATMHLDYPEERQLGQSAEVNAERIDQVLAPNGQSLLAAGGLCAPVAVSYDLARVDSDERPLRDALPRFGAERGGIRFITPPSLADVTGGVEVWTEATDSAPGEDTKDIVTIVCGDETTVNVHAVTMRAQIGNFARRTFPEQFDAWWGLLGSQHARVAENQLWDDMVAAAVAASTTQALGATRDLLAAVDQAAAAYRFRHRMPRRAQLRLALPDYVREVIRADLARQLAGDDTYNVSDQQIDGYFTARNISPIWSLDAGSNNTWGTQADGGGLTAFPSTVEGLLFHEGAFLYLDGGELDLGVDITDSTLQDTNDVQAFAETFEGVAFVGVDALAVTFDICPSGESQGTVAATICGS